MFEQVAKTLKESVDKMAMDMADQMGNPTDVTDLTQEEEVQLWNEVGVDPQTGQPYNPSELLDQGMTMKQILDLARPNRSKMYAYRRPNPKDWVDYAEKMKSNSK